MKKRSFLALSAVSMLSTSALAQLSAATPRSRPYPDRPIRLLVPWPAAGAADAAARILADRLSPRLGQPVVVENKPGANGMIGARLAAEAAPDGYTLFMGNGDTNVLNPQTYRKVSYDPIKQFEPVAFIGRVPGVLVARSGLAINSGQELIKAAKARPGQITFASWGIGSTVHIALLMMEQAAGVSFLHVPFQGTAAAVGQVLGGQIDLVFITPSMAVGMAKAGKVRIVGASSSRRISSAAGIPTLAEQGFTGLNADTWNGLMAPTGTPLQIRKLLNVEVNNLMEDTVVAQKLRESGHEVNPMSTSEFSYFTAMEYERWGRIIRERKISTEAAT